MIIDKKIYKKIGNTKMLTLKNKIIRITGGKQHYISIPKVYIDDGLLEVGTEYTIIIKETKKSKQSQKEKAST